MDRRVEVKRQGRVGRLWGSVAGAFKATRLNNITEGGRRREVATDENYREGLIRSKSHQETGTHFNKPRGEKRRDRRQSAAAEKSREKRRVTTGF